MSTTTQDGLVIPEGVRPIRGPSAVGGDPRRFLALTWTLAVTEFRLKFFGSILGYFWQLMKPLALFTVLYVVFTQFIKFSADVPHYPEMLLVAVVLNMFFQESTAAAVGSVVNRENLVRKIHFPRMVIPLSTVLTAFFNFLLNFFAIFVFFVISGVKIRWSWLEIVPIMGLLLVFCTGIGMALSALFVRYRDISPIWDVALPVLFYGSPVLYTIETLPSERLQHIMMCNPLAVVIQQSRHALVDPEAASAAEAIGGAPRLLIPLAIVAIVFAAGYVIFDRSARHIAEEL